MTEAFEKIKERLGDWHNHYDDGLMVVQEAIEIVNQVAEECKDKYVSIGAYNQVAWERDIAIKQLHELGYEFGQKIDSNDGWIPCSERLPEERDWYLAVFQEPDTGFIGLPYIAEYLLGKHTNATTFEGWIIKDCTDVDDACEYYKDLMCVAWRKLPPNYQPKGE